MKIMEPGHKDFTKIAHNDNIQTQNKLLCSCKSLSVKRIKAREMGDATTYKA